MVDSRLSTDLAGVAEEGLFRPRGARPIELYRHQEAMLRASVVDQSDTVILTGTGSGKTESIYLPSPCGACSGICGLARGSCGPAE